MAKHSVNVLIKARDEASRKFGIIAVSAKVMGKAITSAAAVAKKSFEIAFRTIKRTAIGIAAAFSLATYAAIKQEAAEIELISALKIANEYSEERMKKLKAEAAAIQEVTVYGDEYVLSLMRQAMTLGVAADKTGEAAKAAIALFEGFGGGRGKPAIFLRYYIDALRDTGSSLESYVGALRNAETQEQKLEILQDALARGWDVAKSKSESAGGALKQVKNIIGDVAETIGRPFLPAITNAAKAVKKWAKDNVADISYWSQKVYSSLVFVKDIMWDFVTFMKEDWRAGISLVFDSFLKILKATFDAAAIMAIAGGKGIAEGLKRGFLGDTGGWIQKMAARAYLETVEYGPGKRERIDRMMEVFEKERKEKGGMFGRKSIQDLLGNAFEEATKTYSDTFKAILKDMPGDLRAETRKAWEDNLQRLKELQRPRGLPGQVRGAAGAPEVFSMVEATTEAIKNIVSRVQQTLRPREARFLTFAPGTKFDYEKQTAANTREQIRIQKESLKNGRKMLREMQRRPQAAFELETTAFA